MLTENSQSIISTIRSRCQIIDLQPLHPQQLREALIQTGMSEANAKLMSALTNNQSDAIEWVEDKWFVQARKIVLQLIDKYLSNPEDSFLFLHQHWMPHFKERQQQEQGLDLLLLAFKDLLYSHIGREESLVMLAINDERVKSGVLYFSQEKLIAILHALLTAKQKLRQNVHPTLVMEQLALHIQR